MLARLLRPLEGAYWVVATVWVAAIGLNALPGFAHDARLYFDALVPFAPYASNDYASGTGFYYAPPIALALAPLASLGWPVFSTIWSGLSFAALGALGRRYALPLLFLVPVYLELWSANVALLMGAAIVIGFRYPAAWAFVLLTKLTPGIGLLWFAVRREWRSLAIALVTTGAISLATYAVAPELWVSWWSSLVLNSSYVGDGEKVINVLPLIARLPIAAAVVWIGARRDQRWTVVVAATIATPVLWWNTFALLVAVIPLISQSKDSNAPADRPRTKPTSSSPHQG